MTRYPTEGTFELTLRCNMRCQMCMFRRGDDALLREQELTTDQWIRMAEQAAEAGTLNLLLTGGEPLLRKDFIDIYRGLYPLGFLLTLYTNATLVTDPVMETLREMPPHRIGVTLYGTCNEDYEKICGLPDGFDRAMSGLERLMSLPSAVEVRFTPTCDTIDKAAELDRLVWERYGVHAVLSARIFKAVRGGCAQPEHCRPTPQQVVDTTWGQIETRLRESIPAELRHKLQLQIFDHCSHGRDKETVLGCDAGMDSYTITYDGKLIGCQLLDTFHTDALQEGLAAAWNRYPETVSLPPHPCGDCEHLAGCTLCPAVAMAETGNLSGVPDYICRITKLTHQRKEEFNCGEKSIF